MTKAVKKKNRKLRRQIRKTVGSLLMVSAITIAAIPVQDVSATITEAPKRVAVVNYKDSTMSAYETIDGREAASAWQSKVPYVREDAPIYTTGDGLYQFAFVPPAGGGTEIAVILGANISALSEDGSKVTLEIPNQLDGYRKYISNSSDSGFVAVSRNNKYLYYKKKTHREENGARIYQVPGLGNLKVNEFMAEMKVQADGSFLYMNKEGTNEDGTPKEVPYQTTPVYDESIRPCDYLEYDEWKGFEDWELYYWDASKGPNPDYQPTTYQDAVAVEDVVEPLETPSPEAVNSGIQMMPAMEQQAEPPQGYGIVQEAPSVMDTEPDEGLVIIPDSGSTPEPTSTPEATSVATPEPTPTSTPIPTPTATPEPAAESEQNLETMDNSYFQPLYSSEQENEEGGDITGKAESGLKTDTFEKTMDVAMGENTIDAVPAVLTVGGDITEGPNHPEYFWLASTSEYYRIKNATVRYIGRQYLVDPSNRGIWSIGGTVSSSNPQKGVLAGKGQIDKLIIGKDMVGIGDYAFYGCTGLESVTLNNGLNTIGNGAFANCKNMTSFNMITKSEIKAFGKDAFMNCEALTTFSVPINVEAIGDYCFQGCTGLTKIDLMPEGLNPSLNVIGYNAFEGCTNLISMDFPESFKQEYPSSSDWSTISANENNKIPISYFNGCRSMRNITIRNSDLDIVDGFVQGGEEGDHDQFGTEAGCSIENFLKIVPEEFYFEGPDLMIGTITIDLSPIHQTAKAHRAAFRYLGEDRFEKVVECPEDPSHTSTFIVNTQNQLIDMQLDPDCKVIAIPEKIGQYGVSTLSATSFNGKCLIEKIYVPASVNLIETNAFKGCHSLQDVIFTQPENENLVIQDKAFNTQDVDYHQTECNIPLQSIPTLTFTGTVSNTSEPFRYAMDPKNNINVGSQQANTYITYYSGWPTNLTVKYNWETGKNELLDYPRYTELSLYNEDSYPYMTAERVKAAKEAVKAYEDYLGNNKLVPTQDQLDIVNSALNINLPEGIEAIAEGIFSGVDANNESVSGSGGTPGPVDPDAPPVPGTLTANKNIQSITMNTVETVEPYTFAGCSGLMRVYMPGGNEIGDYAFKDCEELNTAEIGKSISTLGIRPFAGCKILDSVNFTDNAHFTCDNGIIFATENGAKKNIVECLEARSGIINASELAGVQGMWKEAFKDCKGINEIDLSETKITDIPYQAFARSSVNRVILPDTTTSIQKGAFWNTNGLYSVDIPNNLIQIAANAFASVEEDANDIVIDDDENATVKRRTDNDKITFLCNDGSAANIYANMSEYNYIKASTYRLVQYLVIPPNVSGATPVQVGKPVKVAIDDLNDTENWPENKYKYEPDLGNSSRFPQFQYDGFHFEKWGEYTEANGQLQSYAQYSQGVVIMFYAKDPADPGASYELVTIVTKDDNFVEPNLNDTRFEDWHFEGYRFVNWTYAPDGLSAFANYANGDCTVTFVDVKNAGQRIVTVNKKAGDTLKKEEIPTPADMAHFTEWESDNGATIRDRIYEDVTFYAGYSDVVNPSPGSSTSPGPGSSTSPGPGSSASPGGPGTSASPSTQPTNRPGETPGPTATPTATPNPGDNVTLYTASISGGSGSGRYPAGAVVSINAYYMGEGQLFDRWTSSTAGVGFANPNASSTTFTMPASNVAVTATYKTGNGTAGGGTGTGGSGSGSGVGQRNTGSTVEITRPGISNTNLAGATVSGATDNFIIKVTEDQAATNAVTAALQARYGDLSRIKYFPMDISLYDSTGRVKIADTSGITVNLTLPLPDELVAYAGNNRVGAVANGALEDLGTRFTTVDGVPCVNFTATHFSPYVIYVDTANLTEGVIDSTPQTGDPIHPKWFLSLGLACVSLILFFKRDKSALNLKKA